MYLIYSYQVGSLLLQEKLKQRVDNKLFDQQSSLIQIFNPYWVKFCRLIYLLSANDNHAI